RRRRLGTRGPARPTPLPAKPPHAPPQGQVAADEPGHKEGQHTERDHEGHGKRAALGSLAAPASRPFACFEPGSLKPHLGRARDLGVFPYAAYLKSGARSKDQSSGLTSASYRSR